MNASSAKRSLCRTRVRETSPATSRRARAARRPTPTVRHRRPRAAPRSRRPPPTPWSRLAPPEAARPSAARPKRVRERVPRQTPRLRTFRGRAAAAPRRSASLAPGSPSPGKSAARGPARRDTAARSPSNTCQAAAAAPRPARRARAGRAQEARFAHARVADEHELKQVVVVALRHGGGARGDSAAPERSRGAAARARRRLGRFRPLGLLTAASRGLVRADACPQALLAAIGRDYAVARRRRRERIPAAPQGL